MADQRGGLPLEELIGQLVDHRTAHFGLGDAAVFSDLMPSAILEGDVLIEMLMTFLPDAERHFVPLGRAALERL